jgi:hypothetical protein
MTARAVRDRSSETVAVIVRKPGSPEMLAVHENVRSFATTSPPVAPSS